ncbi:hypothetical protein Tco_1201785 [Tanacetum coccineum]
MLYLVARWRSRVTARPSSSSEFPIAPVTAPPGIRRRSAILIRPGEAIPFGRPYRTHLNGPRKLPSPHSSSPVHLRILRQFILWVWMHQIGHSGPSTRDVSPRLCYPPRRAPRQIHQRDHCIHPSHLHGPSRKRCRSPVDSVPSSMLVMRSLAPTRADLLPPRKRFRDSYSSEASIEEDTEIDSIKDGRSVEPAEEDSSDSSGTRDGIVRLFEDIPIDLDDVVRDFYQYMSEVRIDRIVGIETAQRRLEAD